MTGDPVTFDVTIRVTVTPGDAVDGHYDGDPDPDAVRDWLIPWLESYVDDNAPYGVVSASLADLDRQREATADPAPDTTLGGVPRTPYRYDVR
jgi:hypothetical protein